MSERSYEKYFLQTRNNQPKSGKAEIGSNTDENTVHVNKITTNDFPETTGKSKYIHKKIPQRKHGIQYLLGSSSVVTKIQRDLNISLGDGINELSIDPSDGKLGLVGIGVNLIGKLSEDIALKIQILYLSNNMITDLSGIELLTQIHTLSVANNMIKSLHNISYLSKLPNLKKLTINGNLICHMPYAKDLILANCTKLSILDGIAISETMREHSVHRSRTAQLLINSTALETFRVHIIEHISRLLQVQNELLTMFHSKFRYFKVMVATIT